MRSSTTNEQCSGRWPGVCSTRIDTAPTEITSPSVSGSDSNSGSASGCTATGRPCSSASLPCPDTWSACVCVSSTRSTRTPSSAAAASSSSTANGGSTTTATPASVSPTRYDAQPRSSFTNCRKSSTDRDVNTARGGRSRGGGADPAVDPGEERDESQDGRDDRDHEGGLRERAGARVLRRHRSDVEPDPVGDRLPGAVADEHVEEDGLGLGRCGA